MRQRRQPTVWAWAIGLVLLAVHLASGLYVLNPIASISSNNLVAPMEPLFINSPEYQLHARSFAALRVLCRFSGDFFFSE